ncbi:MAG: hypothetical protein ACI86H_002904, partial [bacterium]
MLILSEKECLEKIAQEECFQGEVEGIFSIKIEEYSFFVCTAIHDGHSLRNELIENCLLNDAERLYEEDPYTSELISAMPITLVGLDSRYEYDLNRPQETCIYKKVWGKKVWKEPLKSREKSKSLEKHQLFYRVLNALINKVETLHDACLVYDVHSYNYVRMGIDNTPTFNIGTEQINIKKWGATVKYWIKNLNTYTLPNITTRATMNEVFYGRGYLSSFVKSNFKKTLVLPTEVKKVFMDEQSGDLYPLVLADLKEFFKQALLANALFFSKKQTDKKHRKKSALLSSAIDPALIKLDKQLFNLCKGLETLFYINPKNLAKERKKFFSKKFSENPEFTYRQLDINPFDFREKLYRLPVKDIADISIQKLYQDVIDSFANKIDLIASVGTDNFLYNSLRYYGEPNEVDIQAAQFLLFAKEFEENQEPTIHAKEAKIKFIEAAHHYGIHCQVEITDKIIATAMVTNPHRTILINKNLHLNEIQMNALIHHELGVHMVTTVNSELQNLKVFKLGLPGNTYSQEGLAILSEYQSGHLPLSRLKTLALRVIAVRMMVKNYDFSRTFKILINDYNLKEDEAFKLTARVYRGGGFTKDFL